MMHMFERRVVLFLSLFVALLAAGCGGGGGDGASPVEVACEIDPDCAIGRHCVNGVCQAASIFCALNAECPATLVCSNGGCRIKACEATEACGTDRVCVDGRCVGEGVCASDEDCPGERCDLNTLTCAPLAPTG